MADSYGFERIPQQVVAATPPLPTGELLSNIGRSAPKVAMQVPI
jgi:hypothetical protein